MNKNKEHLDPYSSLGTAFHHILFERKEVLMIAFTSGFILGGSLLLLVTANLIAALHGSVYTGVAAFTAEAMLLLRTVWVLGSWICTEHKVKRASAILSVFRTSVLVSFALPFFLVVSFMEELRTSIAKTVKTNPHIDQGTQFTRLFSQAAHIR